jgi:rod shape determining protein RodA
MAIDRRLVFNIDWVLLGASLLLALIGVGMIFSATHLGRSPTLYLRQLALVGIGLLGLIGVLTLDYRRLADRAPMMYFVAVLGLLYLLRFGHRVAGARRWFFFRGVPFQLSEVVKLVAALLLAKLFSESKKDSLGVGDIVIPGTAVCVLVMLIAAEPDLGTAFCLVPLFLTVAFLAGLRLRAILILAGVVLLAGGLGWKFVLQKYQKVRIYSFLDPSRDLQGAGYQTQQSKIAVGSGGLTGKGFGKGSQSQLGYLPARHTDFIFSVLAEETGFAGVISILALYLLVLFRALEAAQLARDRVGAFLAAGIGGILAFQVVYNVAMVAGLVPVKGLPLPFMSYGGSSVLSSLLGVGLILNVRMRRFAN